MVVWKRLDDRMKIKAFFPLVLIGVLTLAQARNEDVWGMFSKKIYTAVSYLEEHYYQEIDHEKLAYGAIRGILQTLDPHSYFLDPSRFSRLTEEYEGKYHGLGIQIQKQEDRLVVIAPIEGGPAYRLGIQAGDIISHVNGESTKTISSLDAVQKLRGPKGTKVNITIVREGLKQPLELTITREEIPLHSVPYAFLLNEEAGYIFIRNFSSTTTREFEEKMELLLSRGMKKLILDLRSNGGGTFLQSVEIADAFLPEGALIVSVRGRNKAYDSEFRARSDGQYEHIPLVLLIDRGSASAPEILSGAIKDNDRGLIVGENSFGKGLVQTVFRLAENAAVALTTAKYLTPSGRSIQRDYRRIDDWLLRREVPEEEREVRYTSSGRKVLGQGGIDPDYEAKTELHDQTFAFLYKGAFFSYARKFKNRETPFSKKIIFSGEREILREDASGKLTAEKLTVDSHLMDDFKAYLEASQIEFSPLEFKEAEEEIRRELLREVSAALWGAEEGWKVYQESDPVTLKAWEVLAEAAALVKKAQSAFLEKKRESPVF